MKHGESIFAWLWFVVYCLLLFWAAVQSTELEVKYRVTAYCPCEKCCGKFADGITASGHVIKPGDKFVAAPKSIPFGTVLDVPGYGIVKVEDRGGAIKDGRLDVFFGDKNGVSGHQRALEWGVKYLTITQIERGEDGK